MQLSDLTARQYFEEVQARPARAKFGFGQKAAIVNIDMQKAYTAVGEFATAYETDPRQIEYITASPIDASAARSRRRWIQSAIRSSSRG